MSNIAEFRSNRLLRLEYSLATGRSIESLMKKAEGLHGNMQFNTFLQQTSRLDWLDYDESLNANISVIRTVAKSLSELEQGVCYSITELVDELNGKRATTRLDKIFPMLESEFWGGVTKGELLPLLKEFTFWLDYIDELDLGDDLDSADSLLKFLQQPLFKQVTRLVELTELVPANWDLDANVFQNILKGISRSDKEFVQEWLSSVSTSHHYNAKSHREYKSLYTWMFLSMLVVQNNYKFNLWATKKQWLKMGYKLKPDAKPAPVFHYFTTNNDNDVVITDEQKAPDAVGRKISIVYNADEVVGFGGRCFSETKVTSLPILERRIDELGVRVEHHNGDAYYLPHDDVIFMPDKSLFKEKDATKTYYATLLHEMVHWTGHETRCNRQFGDGDSDPAYAFEELVAEIGSSFLCSRLGLTKQVRESSIRYIAGWLSELSDMVWGKTIQDAGTLANRASSFIYVPKRDD
ncbi:hypothetical protein GMES_0976 [Paraglaciecola mesophila KMM 241]|uniref:DNA primase n=1 Tax=Paraglaciecola mesophila KMM 241 TaxID=1128912 RepID=K6ZIR2_9ALTE|nr:zincin-like metallopeptidase domain-containing protein [Paraglaciecola mesophila]GAC23275.1 hypothetical protein GMES_0976 [Paraglaciecola mesophila KMM 241]